MIQPAFLGQHGLAFDDPLRVVPPQNVQHDLVVFFGIGGPMNDDASRGRVGFELFQVIGQVRNRFGLDRRGTLAKVFPFRHRTGLPIPLGPHEPQGVVVPLRTRLVGDKIASGFRMIDDGKHGWLKSEGGRTFEKSGFQFEVTGTFLPARTWATCMTWTGFFWRRVMPCKCIKQLMSAETMTSLPLCKCSPMRSRLIASDTFASLTAN